MIQKPVPFIEGNMVLKTVGKPGFLQLKLVPQRNGDHRDDIEQYHDERGDLNFHGQGDGTGPECDHNQQREPGTETNPGRTSDDQDHFIPGIGKDHLVKGYKCNDEMLEQHPFRRNIDQKGEGKKGQPDPSPQVG